MEIMIGILIVLLIIIATWTTISFKKEMKSPEPLDNSEALLNRTIGEQNEKIHELVATVEEQELLINELKLKVQTEEANNKKILSQKKSSEVRLGAIAENLVPFLDGCPYNPKNMIFLGQPFDYLVMDYEKEEIVFLEVKSGNSKESARQKTIKNIIKNNKVFFEVIRVGQKGVKRKREGNNAK